ncbi:hypothetical protein [Cytobacillus sp. IB215665]|uniref:hypothetical protein n=1 Tax=Cytobacillus sp. IB215665 TaxID=3097357 RepID=UPI002A0C58E0|nr:hypothetical protein [Cytobacillus sp. IB215665]MDX8367778.1 hypothetical protein [Cytobacillus sp. IB215665]
MPKLRDYLKSDLNTFFNTDEFGEVHTLGSKEVVMIIYEDGFGEKSGRANDLENATQSIYESVTTIYLKASDYKKPSVGKRIKLDGKNYYVVDTSVTGEILKISLEANESYG